VYWLARMLDAGDPKFTPDSSSLPEDIGNADPYASACGLDVYADHVGMPEARIILAQCTTHLASRLRARGLCRHQRSPDDAQQGPDAWSAPSPQCPDRSHERAGVR
jgi:hypothetical protein